MTARLLNARTGILLAVVLVAAAVAGAALLAGRETYGFLSVKLDPGGPEPRVIETDVALVDRLGGLIAADLNADGRRDFLITTPGSIHAFGADGEELWSRQADIQLTGQAESEGLPGLHAPGVQVVDLDGDGKREVLHLTRSNELAVIDAATGRQRDIVSLPAPPGDALRWEHLVAASFREPDSADILLQATDAGRRDRRGRHLAAFTADALLRNGAAAVPLWSRSDFLALAHGGARVADLDGDGRHEVLGGDIVGPAGERLFRLSVEGHLDALAVADVRPDLPGLEVVALEEGGPQRVFLYSLQGLIWETSFRGQEPQNAAVGEFDPDRPGLEIWLRSRHDRHQRPWVLDARGEVIAAYQMADVAPRGWTTKGLEVIFPIHWTGDGRQLAAAKERHRHGHVALFDPVTGAFRLRIAGEAVRLYVADVSGDWREEFLVLSGKSLRIYENPAANPQPDRDRLWSSDAYRRSRMTWNYYSPRFGPRRSRRQPRSPVPRCPRVGRGRAVALARAIQAAAQLILTAVCRLPTLGCDRSAAPRSHASVSLSQPARSARRLSAMT